MGYHFEAGRPCRYARAVSISDDESAIHSLESVPSRQVVATILTSPVIPAAILVEPSPTTANAVTQVTDFSTIMVDLEVTTLVRCSRLFGLILLLTRVAIP